MGLGLGFRAQGSGLGCARNAVKTCYSPKEATCMGAELSETKSKNRVDLITLFPNVKKLNLKAN